MRKCVSVISTDMGMRGKASSLPRRLFSLSWAEWPSKPHEDKQCCLTCQGPVCFVSLSHFSPGSQVVFNSKADADHFSPLMSLSHILSPVKISFSGKISLISE